MCLFRCVSVIKALIFRLTKDLISFYEQTATKWSSRPSTCGAWILGRDFTGLKVSTWFFLSRVSFQIQVKPFHFVALVSPIKFDLGYDIYLMVAYIEYIWLKRNESESSLTKITQLLLKKVVQQRTGNFDLKFLCGSVFNQDEALVKY